MRPGYIIFSLAAFIVSAAFPFPGLRANIGVIESPHDPAGGILISAPNRLRVVAETISYEIDKSSLNAAVKVNYRIKNEADTKFSDSFFFIISDRSKVPTAEGHDTFRLLVNGMPREFTAVSKKGLSDPKMPNLPGTLSGAVFTVNLQPGKTADIEASYIQSFSYSRRDGGLSAASASRFLNFFKDKIGSLKSYSYLIYPIKSFGGGTDSITVRI